MWLVVFVRRCVCFLSCCSLFYALVCVFVRYCICNASYGYCTIRWFVRCWCPLLLLGKWILMWLMSPSLSYHRPLYMWMGEELSLYHPFKQRQRCSSSFFVVFKMYVLLIVIFVLLVLILLLYLGGRLLCKSSNDFIHCRKDHMFWINYPLPHPTHTYIQFLPGFILSSTGFLYFNCF